MKRNRIRRRIYEVVRRFRKETDKSWEFDLVLTVFDEQIATMLAPELEKAVKELFQKAKII